MVDLISTAEVPREGKGVVKPVFKCRRMPVVLHNARGSTSKWHYELRIISRDKTAELPIIDRNENIKNPHHLHANINSSVTCKWKKTLGFGSPAPF